MSRRKIMLHLDDGTVLKVPDPEDVPDATMPGVACPACKAEPLVVHGFGRRHDYDTFYADAMCMQCQARVGELRVKVNTLFGISEDEAVLQGRCRVY
jgi:hypothetical protein